MTQIPVRSSENSRWVHYVLPWDDAPLDLSFLYANEKPAGKHGFLTVKGEKMSKSLGNFITIREALRTWNKDVLRYFILLSHYRSPLQATDEGLANAAKGLDHIRAIAVGDKGPDNEGRKAFIDAMDADLNTPMALAAIQSLAANGDIGALQEYGAILGINFLRETSAPLSVLQDIRAELRAQKQFEVADLIRERMVAAGITITDAPLP